MALTGIATLLAMLFFEASKQFLLPDINIWESHTVTIVFTATMATAIAAVVWRRSNRLNQALTERIGLTSLTADVGLALNRQSDLSDCLRLCTEAAVRHLGAAFARIWTLNTTDNVLELRASSGMYTHIDGAHRRIPVGQFKIGRIAQDCRPVLTNEVVGDPEVHDQEWAKREGMVAFAGYPLVVDDRVIGVLALFARRRLSEAVITALGAVADHIALGIVRHESEAQRQLLASVVNDSDDAIISKTLDGVILSWNVGAEMLYGYTAAEAVGQPISLIMPPERSTELPELLDGLRAGKHLKHYESVRRRKGGSDVPVSLTLSPIRDATGQIVAASSIARDMSERLRTVETLRVSEERLRRIAETITEVFWIADVTIQTMIYVSPAYERIWGRTCESLYEDPRSFLEAIHPDDRERVLEDLSAQQTGLPFDHEYRIVRPDGQVRWIWDRGFPALGAGGIQQYVGAAQDVTDRWHAEKARQEAEERMRFALEAAHVGVWEADLTTGITYWSETCEKLHGLPPGTFGRTFDAFLNRIHADDRESSRLVMDHALRDHRDAALEYRTIYPNGIERRISATAHFSFDDAGAPVRGAGIAFDVTDRRSLEDQFRQAQKMEAVGQLAGGIAHDFNNVLTAILGYAEFVISDLPAEDPHRADIDEIKKAGQRAAALTRQLLAFSRKQLLAPRVLHLGDVVSAIAPMLRRLLGETIDLRTTMSDRGDVMADGGQTEQVLVNLAVNARDAMKGGGCLTIETADVLLDEAYAQQHESVQQGPSVMLAARDTSAGLRTVLYHKADGRRHGSGPGQRVRHREAERRSRLGVQRSRARHNVQGVPAAD